MGTCAHRTVVSRRPHRRGGGPAGRSPPVAPASALTDIAVAARRRGARGPIRPGVTSCARPLAAAAGARPGRARMGRGRGGATPPRRDRDRGADGLPPARGRLCGMTRLPSPASPNTAASTARRSTPCRRPWKACSYAAAGARRTRRGARPGRCDGGRALAITIFEDARASNARTRSSARRSASRGGAACGHASDPEVALRVARGADRAQGRRHVLFASRSGCRICGD